MVLLEVTEASVLYCNLETIGVNVIGNRIE